ncbi:hypothetical protein ACN4EG_06150 [Alkalinema pantanalense CENA528]|uniref:hypothetical protein n=1 Tax=Alkalinema pantanalense TaxID=1620705 RepID=UPI003D6F32B2
MTLLIAINDLSQDSTDDTQKLCAVRWKIKQFHRELKPTTGLEACQCCKQRIQRNPIACALLVWTRLLSNYLIEQLKSSTLPMRLSSDTPHI